MPFGPVDPQVDLVALEEEVLERWRKEDLPAMVADLRAGGEPWIFYEGPPTANGRPGLHHVWARVFKDLFPRFRTMQGRDVPRKGGWDCHGLPVEIEVEKALGFTRKQDIEEYGIEAFNRMCRESVQRYVADWETLTERAGVWIDTDDAYWTLTNDYIESVWWLVKQMWDEGLLYEGHRVSPYCARCGTALSSHEVAQGYHDVTDPSVYVRFPVVDRDVDLLVWTTTPWTLVSNVGVAAGPSIDYVRVPSPEPGGRDLVMAAARVDALFGDDVEILERFAGTDLVGWRYERPFDLVEMDETGGRVVNADYVSTDDGSGLVHLAPAFGAEDMEIGKAEGLPILNPVGPDGTFDDRVTPFAGQFVKDADPLIIADLLARGLLVREEPYTHSYPHCWRCGTPLIYWAKTSWFARTSERRPQLLEQNDAIGWHPEHIRRGRFGDWLENNVDWALSRDRYWGTPLPVWRCESGHDTCVGSVAELAALAGRDLSDLDLHRPYVDDVEITCPLDGCGAPATRLLPVLDAWFDSGSMPSAQHHFVGPAGTLPSAFPADFICEAIDQTRGWFYSLLAVNTLVFGQTPYRNVVCLAHIVDEQGQKMSKSRGNIVDPWDMFREFGSDALRWYFFSSGSPWTNRRVFGEGIRESTRKTLLTLWNVWSFFATYADIDGWTPADGDVEPTHVLDRWVLGRLDDTVSAMTSALAGFDALEGATQLASFIDDLSNWYVRRSRPRFWKASDPVAHATLHRCLVVTSQLLAPFCPFVADELYVALTGEESVHLSDWPEASGAGDTRLAAEMAAARQLVALGRAARTDAKVRVRQPLRRALLLHPGVTLSSDVAHEVADELNVKALEDVESLTDLISWTVVPNFRTLGPRLGAKVNAVKQALATADGSALKRQLDEHGWCEIAGERLSAEDVEIRATQHEDFALAQEGSWAVALDLEIDEALRVEGLARELVRALNDLRKDRGFAIADRVVVSITGSERVAAALDAHGSWIAAEVLALELRRAPDGDGATRLDLDPDWAEVSLTQV